MVSMECWSKGDLAMIWADMSKMAMRLAEMDMHLVLDVSYGEASENLASSGR